MNINDKFLNISVLGAAGKMGSGIVVLNALHVSTLMFRPEYKEKVFVINAIDQSLEALNQLQTYVAAQLQSYGEKNINTLREYYSDNPLVIENLDVVQYFVRDVLSVIRFTRALETSFFSELIFEAVTENLELKAGILSRIHRESSTSPWFFTNTSSIPIEEINKKASLEGNLVGCHFYNPPVVQKLIELINMQDGNKPLNQVVSELAKTQRKIVVPSNDVAGFIGNGVFIREIAYAFSQLKILQPQISFSAAVLLQDSVTRDFLLRPMGIFQLIDYVGIDVCAFITRVMNSYLPETINGEALEDLLAQDVKGGQESGGVQRDGLFRYEKGKPIDVYDNSKSGYVAINTVKEEINNYLNSLSTEYTWKALSRDKHVAEKLQNHFSALHQSNSKGAALAIEYLEAMKGIGQQLLESGATTVPEDINKVMMLGFYQLYGPLNNF
jgi:3-hydroxyacyl-CoA dehydrogenase